MATTRYEDMSPQFWDNFNSWISYYRRNVHRFIEEYLGIKLHFFQKILIYCMSKPNSGKQSTFNFFASRGIGKTFLTMVFALAMAILYPGMKIVVASSSIRTSRQFMEKINLLKEYPNLMQEIEKDGIRFGKEEHSITLKSGSEIMSKVCSDNSRGARCHMLILDERNIMDSDIISSVFDWFLTEKRNIPAYRNKEYSKYRKSEHNYRISLTSIGYSDEDAYIEFVRDYKEMIKGDESIDVFSLPYQFGVEAGVIDHDFMIKQAKKNRNNIEVFQSEAEVIPIGTSENAIFNHVEINRSRQILTPLVEPTFKQYLEVHGNLKDIPTHIQKQNGETRVLSVDIATAFGRKNDSSAWTLFRLTNKGDYYDKYVSFHRAVNGANIDAQVLYTKRLWHYFDVDYIVFDAAGGIGHDFMSLMGNVTVDLQLGRNYPGMKTVNKNETFDVKVTDPSAKDVLYAMVVSGAGASQKQADMAHIAKINFDRNRVFMLINDTDGIDELNSRYKYMKLRTSQDFNERDIAENMIMSYVNTEELIHEMLSVKLKRIPSGRHTIEEDRGERKDRLISLLYGFYFIDILEQDLSFIEKKRDLSSYFQSNVAAKNIKTPFGNRGGFTGGFGKRR